MCTLSLSFSVETPVLVARMLELGRDCSYIAQPCCQRHRRGSDGLMQKQAWSQVSSFAARAPLLPVLLAGLVPFAP